VNVRRAIAGALLAALAACSAGSIGSVPREPSPAPATGASIPLGINTGSKPGYHLTISVGGAATQDFLLDTGSSGFWVYPNAIGKYRATSYTVSNKYGSGIVYSGRVVYTHVDFGGGIVTGEVPVALVEDATCTSGKTCPAQPGSTFCPSVKPGKNAGVKCLEFSRRLYGTFGADLATINVPDKKHATAELYNAVTPGALIVGEQSLDGYAKMRLTTATVPIAMPNGAQPWQRDVHLCYTVGTALQHCFRSLFDTGATDVAFQANVTIPQTSSKCGEQLTPGTPVTIQTDGHATIASFQAGSTTNFDRVITSKAKQPPQVNTGMTFFNRNVMYYDAKHGFVAIKPLTAPVHVATEGCGSN
jgi:hypothetical protein